jgi:hypothetical protein
MTDCEKCPFWGPDENGSHTCRTRYCIDDPLGDRWEEMDSIYDEIQMEREYYEMEMVQECQMEMTL